MLNLPVSPNTRITRQLSCISCHEKFVIAEDDSIRDRHRSPNWQSPPDDLSVSDLRYHPDRTRRSITPEARAIPDVNPDTFQDWNDTHREHINCPRCGADNRNWLQMQSPPIVRPRSILDTLLSQKILVWRQRFPAAYMGIVCAFFFAFLIFLYILAADIPTPQAITFLTFIILAAVAPAAELTGDWRRLRESRYSRRVVKVRRIGEEARLWLRGLFLVFVSAAIFPILIFHLGPKALSFVEKIINPVPAADMANAVTLTMEQLNDYLANTPEEVAAVVGDTIKKLKDIPTDDQEAIKKALEEFSGELDAIQARLVETTAPVTIKQIQELETAVDEARASLEKVRQTRQEEINKVISEAGRNVSFLALWLLIVGLTGLISVLTSMAAVKRYVEIIDGQLPPPIYYSLANMTRVVVWEAKRALEIGDEVQHMQWTFIKRIDDGGVVLEGLYRETPPPDQRDDDINARVRAQFYRITSDRWGRILETKIESVRALVRPYHYQDARAISDAFFDQVPRDSLENQRPFPPG